jgi:hypothetical protein
MSDTRINPYPALASIVIPAVADLVREHVKNTPFLSQPKSISQWPSSAASLSVPAVCDPAGAGEEVS